MVSNEASLKQLEELIEHNILIDLYCRNNSGYRIELSQAIYFRFKKVFNKQFDSYEKSKNEILNIYVENEGIDILKIYTDKAKEICKALRLNLVINPQYADLNKHDLNKNNYFLITNEQSIYSDLKHSSAAGIFLLLDTKNTKDSNLYDTNTNYNPFILKYRTVRSLNDQQRLKKIHLPDSAISMAFITRPTDYKYMQLVCLSGVETCITRVSNELTHDVQPNLYPSNMKAIEIIPLPKTILDQSIDELFDSTDIHTAPNETLNDKIKNIRDTLNHSQLQNNKNKLY